MKVTVLRNPRSQGARRLANALGCGLATADSRRSTRQDRYVINWGCNEEPEWVQRALTISNSFDAVDSCRDKITTFELLSEFEVPVLEWCSPENSVSCQRWLEEDGKIVVRHTTTGHSGAGIEIFRQDQLAQGQAIPAAPLYTRYFRKQAEYRVHVCYGNVILVQQKRKMNSDRRPEGGNNQNLVRTYGNGWVFTVNNLDCDTRNYRAAISELAINACAAVGANHAAVDILVKHNRANTAVVCELNSAPGIEAGSTLEAYTNAFRQKIAELGE